MMLTGLGLLQKGEVLPSFYFLFSMVCKVLVCLPTHGHLCESQAQEYCTYLNRNNTVCCHCGAVHLGANCDFSCVNPMVFLCLCFCFVIVQKSQHFHCDGPALPAPQISQLLWGLLTLALRLPLYPSALTKMRSSLICPQTRNLSLS